MRYLAGDGPLDCDHDRSDRSVSPCAIGFFDPAQCSTSVSLSKSFTTDYQHLFSERLLKVNLPWSMKDIAEPMPTTMQECQGYYGDAEIFEGDPSLLVYRDVLYVPFHDPFSPHGIFDSGRKLVISTAYYNGPDFRMHSSVTQYRRHQVTSDAGDEVFVYGGDLHHHYGHFLLSTFSRYWPYVRNNVARSLRIAVHEPIGAAEYLSQKNFAAELFRAIGLREENFVTFSVPTRLKELIIPAPSFEESSFAHSAYADLCNFAGDIICKSIPSRPSHRPVHLSKERLTSGVRRVTNEQDLTNHLAKHGVDIVFPETLEFAEQIALWKDRPAVSGFVGSALHTGILAPGRSVVGISDSDVLNTSFRMIDLINNTNSMYFGGTNEIMAEVPSDGSPFSSLKSLIDPASVAETVLRGFDRLMSDKTN